MEADRRHTTTGFECRKSCLQSCLDLAQLVVDGDAETLERSGRDVDVARPGLARNGRLDGLSQIAGGAERAPRHDELGDPASPAFFAVLTEDALEVGRAEIVDHVGRGYIRGGVHAHVERTVGAEAEPAPRVVQLGAGETEVEEDQVCRVEALAPGDVAQLGEPSVSQHGPGAKFRQGHPTGFGRSGIAVDPEQPAAGCDPLQDQAGVARLPEGAVDRDRPHSGLKELYYLL